MKRRKLFPEIRKNKIKRSDGPDSDYGMAEPLIDSFSPKEIEEKKTKFLETLNRSNFLQIEKETRGQCDAQNWYKERRTRLTASRYGQICKMRSNTSCKNTVYNILYGTEPHTKSLQYGRDMEANARQKFEHITSKKVIECGLVVDPDIPFLAASPGIFLTDTII